MTGEPLTWLLAITLALTSTGLLVSQNWRWNLGFFALQYFAGFWILLQRWQLSLAAAVLLSGWMTAATLGISILNLSQDQGEESSWPEGGLFRLLSAGMILLAISSSISGGLTWLPDASLPLTWGALSLIGLGIMHLGMTMQPFRMVIGLLTMLLGFELFYSVVENSILVTTLLVFVKLGLALAGSFLMLSGEKSA